jgi:U4/U6.U5 tri-snRNP-associated protein 2
MDDDFGEHPVAAAPAPPPTKCPFLDTVNRQVMDFDMPKLCSISLAKVHVYGCLVCGKFFAGRGKHTFAYTHSVQAFHHVFINLHDGRIYCLPDMYEVTDASLDDVKFALNPAFSRESISAIDSNTHLSTDILGVSYLPGFIGLNNLKATDFVNVVVQLLSHVHPLRNYFLRPENYAHARSALVQRFGELVRKVWSPAAFKGTVSPLDFITEVSVASKQRFNVGQPAEAQDLLAWLLNALHADLTEAPVVAVGDATPAGSSGVGSKRGRLPGASDGGGPVGPPPGGYTHSIITEVFQGELEVVTLSSELDAATAVAAAPAGAASNGGSAGSKRRLPFLFLSLDLPPSLLFKDDTGGKVIQNVPLHALLSKYDGVTVTDTLKGQFIERKRYRVTRLPPYLALNIKRFARNTFFNEKNPVRA